MRRLFFGLLKNVFFLVLCPVYSVCAQDNSSYVNPFIGTTKSGVLTKWGGNGGTYPGAVAPSGAIQISPETRITGAKGYDYTDQVLYYFSCIKHYSGFPEGSSGHLFIMPVKYGQNFEPGITSRPFSHQQESAHPGYYQVTLQDDHTLIEAAAGLHTGILRFTFPVGVVPQLFVGDAGEISFPSAHVVQGSLENAVINLSSPVISKTQVKGGYVLVFKSPIQKPATIELKLSTSTVGSSGAQHNIDQELGNINLDLLRKQTAGEWEKQLSAVEITDPNNNHKSIFYTALYHSLLLPWVISDVDGQYKGSDGKLHRATAKHEYGGFSPWDTFRSLHPLLSLLYPEKQQEVIVSMLDVYQQTGHLPTESMTGNHAVPIITDAYFKGIRGFDPIVAYQAMKKNIMEPPFVQDDMELYHQMGYVPFSRSESVTRTVEYAYDDWAMGEYANLVMHREQDYKTLQEHGLNYRNLFEPSALFMLPRKEKEFKIEPGMTGFKEGNKWVYSYFVPHNAKDLVNLMGGDEAFVSRLDSALNHQVILYDNETVLHLPYLFNAAGHPELTQKWLRNIMLTRFSNTPGGLPGNDDLGSMSSAYLFNAMGFFPVSPGRPLYAIGAPLFQSVKLHLANQKTFTITAVNQLDEHSYVRSLRINDQPYEQLVLPHAILSAGGSMQFVMNKTATDWPKDKDPIALSETKKAADIIITDYSISKTIVSPNEQFWIRFHLSNKGSLGSRKVVVYNNGSALATKNCLVPEGTTITDSISCRLYALGRVKLGVSAGKGTIIAVKESGSPVLHPFVVSKLQLKPVLGVDSIQEITYEVQNLTGKKQEFNIPLKTDDSFTTTDRLLLSPGEKREVKHTYATPAAGVKTVNAGGIKAVYKVYNNHLSSLILDLQTKLGITIKDSSGLVNNAVIVSTMDQGNPSEVAVKQILLGDNTFIEVPHAASLDQMGETLSMMAWVYPAGDEKGLVDLFSKGDHHVLQLTDQKTLTFFAGGWGRGDCTVKLPANWKKQWHHIAGVCKGDLLAVYLDGKLAGTATVDGVVNLSVDSKWQIGRNEEFPSERIFHGYMDKIKVYEQPLSAVEIGDIFNKEKTSMEP